jgi:hypothetical protein
METQACSMCGKALSGSDILYTEDARVVCNGCSAKAEISRDEGRAARNIKGAAWSCLGASVFAWFFNPFFIVNIAALLSGIFAIKSVLPGNERFTRYLSPGERTMIWVVTIIGFVLTGLELLVFLIALAAVSSHPTPRF